MIIRYKTATGSVAVKAAAIAAMHHVDAVAIPEIPEHTVVTTGGGDKYIALESAAEFERNVEAWASVVRSAVRS